VSQYVSQSVSQSKSLIYLYVSQCPSLFTRTRGEKYRTEAISAQGKYRKNTGTHWDTGTPGADSRPWNTPGGKMSTRPVDLTQIQPVPWAWVDEHVYAAIRG